jgi:hypothetical protein
MCPFKEPVIVTNPQKNLPLKVVAQEEIPPDINEVTVY